MANSPDVTRVIYDKSKTYLGGNVLQGSVFFDWIYNSDQREQNAYMLNLGKYIAGDGREVIDEDVSFDVSQNSPVDLDLILSPGNAFVGGRFVTTPSQFSYSDHTVNYIVSGTITTFTEVVPTTHYRLYDAEKRFSSSYNLSGCRLIFTSGALSGDTFTISSLVGQAIYVTENLTGAVVGDTYVIAPPLFTTPTADETNELRLVSWFEDISPEEDADLVDPFYQSNVKTQHKSQMRWCVFKDWIGDNSEDPTNGFISILLATLERPSGATTITDAYITNETNTYVSLSTQTVINADHESRIEAAEDITSLITYSDYSPARGYAPVVSFDSDEVSINASRYTTPHLTLAEPSNLAQVSADAITNITAGYSLFYLEEGAGSDEVTLEQQKLTTINNNDMPVLSVVADGSFEVTRALEFSEIPKIQGFNWSIQLDPTPATTVMPGSLFRWGQLYVLPDRYALSHLNAANWDTSSLPSTDDWFYIYVRPASSSRRDLIPFFSELKPKWGGEHPTLKAQCIGTFIYNSVNVPPQFRRGNYIYIARFLPETFAGTVGYTAYTVPPLAQSLQVEVVHATPTAPTATYIRSRFAYSTVDVFTHQINTGVDQSTNLVDVAPADIVEVSTVGTDTISIYIRRIGFDPTNTQDAVFWR